MFTQTGQRAGSATRQRDRQAGFSLVELMVALAVTSIVAGSIYLLMAMGDSAFTREPELTERQQNIRIAMDMIQRDVALAGAGQSPWTQAFSQVDAGGVPLDGSGPLAPQSIPADALEIFASPGVCPEQSVTGATLNQINLAGQAPRCYRDALDQGIPVLVGVSSLNAPFESYLFVCPPAAPTQFTIPGTPIPGVNWLGGGLAPASPEKLVQVDVIKYMIAPDPQGIPSLWRSAFGDTSAAGNCGTPPPAPAPGAPGPAFQMVARGIEDLQVVYTMADGTRANSPAIVGLGTYTNLVREVEVTLVARVIQARLQGSSASATTDFRRGNMVSTIVPRAVLGTLHDPAAVAAGVPQWQ